MRSRLQPGEQVPHFTVVDVNGARVAYGDLWQRKHLLLICVNPSSTAGDEDDVASLRANAAALTAHDTACIVTRDSIDGVPRPGVVIADRWGEIFLVSDTLLPLPQLVEWLRYVQMQCPECQGEAR